MANIESIEKPSYVPETSLTKIGVGNERYAKIIFQGKQDRNFSVKISFMRGLESDKRWVWGAHELLHCSLKKGC